MMIDKEICINRPRAKLTIFSGSAFALQCPVFFLPCGSHSLTIQAKGGSYEYCTQGNTTDPEFRTFETAIELEQDTKMSIEVFQITI